MHSHHLLFLSHSNPTNEQSTNPILANLGFILKKDNENRGKKISWHKIRYILEWKIISLNVHLLQIFIMLYTFVLEVFFTKIFRNTILFYTKLNKGSQEIIFQTHFKVDELIF